LFLKNKEKTKNLPLETTSQKPTVYKNIPLQLFSVYKGGPSLAVMNAMR